MCLLGWGRGGDVTDKPQLRELQDHPLLGGLLQGKVLHRAEIVWFGHDIVLQLQEEGTLSADDMSGLQ